MRIAKEEYFSDLNHIKFSFIIHDKNRKENIIIFFDIDLSCNSM
jgi:hypothetical protein